MFDQLRLNRRADELMNVAEATFDPAPLAAFLQEHPSMDDRVEKRARARRVFNDNSGVLVHILALAGSRLAGSLLAQLVDDCSNPAVLAVAPVPWDKLSDAQVRLLAGLSAELIKVLPRKQSLAAVGSFRDPGLPTRVATYLAAGHPAEDLANYFASQVEEEVRSGKVLEALPASLDDLAQWLWQKGERGAALNVVTTMRLMGCRIDWLEEIARALPTLRTLSLLRAANLLRLDPDPGWLPYLRDAWVRIDEELDAEYERESTDRVLGKITRNAVEYSDATHGAAAISVALGACAAVDSRYTHIENADPSFPEYEAAIARWNDLATEDRKLTIEFGLPETTREKRKEIERRKIEMHEEFKPLQILLKRLRRQHRGMLSPGRLLMFALQDGQRHSAGVRQAAWWGLWKLAGTGSLDADSLRRIKTRMRQSAFDEDEAELQRLVGELPLGEVPRETVWEVVESHRVLGNWAMMAVYLGELGLDEGVCEQTVALVRGFSENASAEHHFRERIIEFARHQRFLELEMAVVDALVWMQDFNEFAGGEDNDADDADDAADWDYGTVRRILLEAHRYIPVLPEFLARYPLRLMSSEHHASVLGKYSRARAGVSMWTRYTPPLWHPGATPEEVGTVQKRYLELEDRSEPNSMGIRWELFRHPALAVPVMYHEFMHFGGPQGDPAKGIDNEAEVHLRELIFTRALIARMAPADEEAVAEYELETIRAFESTGNDATLDRLRWDFSDAQYLGKLNEEILGSYGQQLSTSDAAKEVARRIQLDNLMTELGNKTDQMKLNWCPHIDWPMIDSLHTADLAKRYREVMMRSLMTNHTIDAKRCRAILSEPEVQGFQSDWERYC